MSDIRLRVSPAKYRYPDVMALCGTPLFDDATPPCLLNPAFVVEVLSASTADTDLGKKWGEYRTIASITDYVIVSSEEWAVTHHRRQSDGSWLVRDYRNPEDTLTFAGLEVTLTLGDLDEKIALSRLSDKTAEPSAEVAAGVSAEKA